MPPTGKTILPTNTLPEKRITMIANIPIGPNPRSSVAKLLSGGGAVPASERFNISLAILRIIDRCPYSRNQ